MTIRDIRVAAGRSLRSVADAVGISHVFLGEIERGIRPLPSSLAPSLARALGVEPSQIKGRAPLRVDVADLSEEERERVALFIAKIRSSRAA